MQEERLVKIADAYEHATNPNIRRPTRGGRH
jgi:hypothetical protein